jgi:hypothetical protein
MQSALDEIAFPKEQPNATWNDLIIKQLLNTAIDRRHRNFMDAQRLVWAYKLGLPVARTEVSGPGGGPMEFDGPANDPQDMTSRQQRVMLDKLREERDAILALEAEYTVKRTVPVVAADEPEPLAVAGGGADDGDSP